MNRYPLVGGLLHVLIPGLAYAYIGRWGRGLVEFIGAVLGLGALLFLAELLESTDPPWPDGITQVVLLVVFYLGMFFEGMRAVRRHNRSGGTTQARSQASGSRTLVVILIGIIVVLCGVLVAVLAFSGGLENGEDSEAVSLSPPAVTAEAGTRTPDVTIPVEITDEPEATAEKDAPAAEETASEPAAVVTHETLNVRAGPGTNYPKVGTLQQGDEVAVTGRNKAGTWLAITMADGTEGWVYAEYTRLDTAVDSLPVAKAAPPPSSPTPSGPTPTLSVDEQIARVAKGEHGTLPQPGEVGGVDAGGEAEVTILNDTPYKLTVLIGSPNSQKVVVEACPGCKVYSIVGPLFCQEEGRPTLKIRLAPGTMEVVARVNDTGVTPFYGTWELKANTAYFNCFYIVSSIR